jgi:hypothetical protein
MRRVGESVFTAAVAGEVLRRIADGETLHAVCGKGRRAGLPERMTVYGWMRRRAGFREAYDLAKAAAEAMRRDVVPITVWNGTTWKRRARREARLWTAVVEILCCEACA